MQRKVKCIEKIHRQKHNTHKTVMVINNLNSTSNNYAEKLQRCKEYIDALEEERRKIQVFQRELPFCLELVTQAIEACKQQLTSSTPEYNFHGQSECSEQTSSEGPVLEEFIPLKRAASSDDDEQQSKKPNNNNNCASNDDTITKDSKNNDNKASKKSDWLRSVQLWNQTPDPSPKEDSPKKVEVKKNGTGGAFHPFKREKSVGTCSTGAQGPSGGGGVGKLVPAAAASSSAETGGSCGGGNGGKKKEEKEGQSERKQRRCWSPELHRRFLQALQQLGGSHVATPKQIRELMKVDGLTNDEVKSHLQKYRLHTRRPNNTTGTQPPQFVVVGGIWVPPPEYAAMATPTASGEASGAANSNGIYAPVAALPPAVQDASISLKQRHQHKQLHSNDRGSHSEGGRGSGGGAHRSNSLDSSSSDTTTASPPAY